MSFKLLRLINSHVT